ncbi:hypothetical protein DITRI_Ditri03aG0088000 [Diplodiscus trichospermus]
MLVLWVSQIAISVQLTAVLCRKKHQHEISYLRKKSEIASHAIQAIIVSFAKVDKHSVGGCGGMIRRKKGVVVIRINYKGFRMVFVTCYLSEVNRAGQLVEYKRRIAASELVDGDACHCRV